MSHTKLISWGLVASISFGISSCDLLSGAWNGSPSPQVQQSSPAPEPSYSEPAPTPSQGPLTKTTLPGNYAAISEKSLNRMTKAAGARDAAALEALERDGEIFPLYANQEVYILGCHGFICSHYSFRYKGKNDELWTYREALSK